MMILSMQRQYLVIDPPVPQNIVLQSNIQLDCGLATIYLRISELWLTWAESQTPEPGIM